MDPPLLPSIVATGKGGGNNISGSMNRKLRREKARPSSRAGSDRSYLLRLHQGKKALTVLLTQALIFAHLLQCRLKFTYVFVFLPVRNQQRLLFG